MTDAIKFAVAECERCGGAWSVKTDTSPDLLEGICMECQEDGDTEKPLTFRIPREGEVTFLPVLPADWIAEDTEEDTEEEDEDEDEDEDGCSLEECGIFTSAAAEAKYVESEFQRGVAERTKRELPWKLELVHPYFEQLWTEAHQAGTAAMQACPRGPAYCFAHIRIPDSLFSEWLRKTGKAQYYADFAGCQRAVRIYDFGDNNIHDCNRLEAYAKAFVRVLVAGGVDAYDTSRLD